jgi:hypothetical protein
LEGVHASFRIAILTEPTGASSKTQSLVESTEEYLALQLVNDMGRADLHPQTVKEKSLSIAVDDLSCLLWRWCVRRTAMSRVVVGTTELALKTDPGSEHDAARVYDLGLDGSKLTCSLQETIKIRGAFHALQDLSIPPEQAACGC